LEVRLRLAFFLALAACQVNEPNLSQTQQLIVNVSPSTYNFGSLQVGSSSLDIVFAVNPAVGENYDQVTAVIENCPDFSVIAPGLPADVYRICQCEPGTICELQAAPICQTAELQSYNFTAQFTPTVPGTVNCAVTVHLNNGTSTKTVTLSGTGTVPPKDIDVTPTSAAFGDVRRNTDSTPITFTVRNVGGTAMTVSSVSKPPSYQMTGSAGPYNLAAGASQTYSLICSPTVVGSVNGNFTVTSDDPVTPTVNIPMTCRGIDSNVGLTPSPTTIATTRVGEPVMQNIAITNSGIATMSLETVTVTGTDLVLMSAPAAGTYGTGPVGNAVVQFGATAGGTQTGTLTITYDGGQTRTSAISARALSTSMSLSPDGDVAFGPVCAGQSGTQTFSILANDEGSFQVTQVGGLVPPFTMAMPTLPANVQGSGANTVQFTVTASPTDAGMQTSELNLVTNIPNSAARTINLSVDALAAGVSPSPTSLDFGSTQPMTTTLGQMIHLSNCATAPAAFTNARIEGEHAGEFAIVLPPTETSVPANGNVTWVVVLSAQTPGLKYAEFVVDHDGGQTRVALNGEGLSEGVGGDDPTTIDEMSYYSCSAGSSSRPWALLLVLGIVLRRRRRR